MSQLADDLKQQLSRCHADFADVHRLMREEAAFAAELKQYREQRDNERSDSGNRVSPTDQSIFRLVRYIGSQVRLRGTPQVRCEPRDQYGDADTAKALAQALEYELFGQPWKMYEDVEHRWIESALLMRVGVYRWDWRPDMGKHGEIFARLVNPCNIVWDTAYLTPHDPYNDAVFEIFRMPVAQAKKMRGWKNTAQLMPDDGVNIGAMGSGNGRTAQVPGWVDFGGLNGDAGAAGKGHDFFTGVMCWQRYTDYTPKPRKLDEGEQHLECPACRFKSKPAGELEEFASAGFRYPAFVEDACPQCGGMMIRVDVEELDDEAMRQSKGKRLVVLCLNGSVDEPLFEGGWPVPKARSFPYAFLTRYRSPVKAVPESDVSLNWSMALGINFTKRVIYEQAHRSRGLWLLPERGLVDRTGTRYDLGDDQDDVAFYGRDFVPGGIQHVEGAPVSAALFSLHNMLIGEFRSNEGSSDVAIAPDKTKDIPVGTLEGLIETGNVPIDDFIKDVYAARSISFGVLADYINYTWTQARWVRTYGPDGAVKFQQVRGSDMPDVDVTVSSGPSMSKVAKEDLEKYMQLSGLTPARRRTVGKLLGVDSELLRQMEQDDIEDMQQQMAMQQVAMSMQPPPGPPEANGNGAKPNNRIAREQV